jgi:hypothetical protein
MHTLDQDLARLVLSGEIEHAQARDLAQELTEFEQLVKNRGLGRGAAGDTLPEGRVRSRVTPGEDVTMATIAKTPQWAYKGTDASGKAVKGVLDATSEAQAIQQLKGRG